MSSTRMISIADVERATGIARATLRVWEQRYGFPQPLRGADGEREYPPEQVQQLQTIALLIHSGHRAGSVVPLDAPQLRRLARTVQRHMASTTRAEPALDLLRQHDLEALVASLRRMCAAAGLEQFVFQLGAVSKAVGASWQCGELQVFEEHAYVEAVQGVLRHAILNLPPVEAAAKPTVLLATIGNEQHGLGLLMAHAIFAVDGCRCIPLGVQLPLAQAAAAAKAYSCDIVAVSFSANQKARAVTDQLHALRTLLPPGIELWSGGGPPGALARGTADGIRRLTQLDEIRPALARWREARAQGRNSSPAPQKT